MGDIKKKYHITDDGKVYRIADNGEVTELGDVSKMESGADAVPELDEPEERRRRSWVWVIPLVIILLSAVAGGLYMLYINTYDHSESIDLTDTIPVEATFVEEAPAAETPVQAAPAAETPAAAAPALDPAMAYADGHFINSPAFEGGWRDELGNSDSWRIRFFPDNTVFLDGVSDDTNPYQKSGTYTISSNGSIAVYMDNYVVNAGLAEGGIYYDGHFCTLVR